MAKMNFDKKGLIELLEFADDDWKKDSPVLQNGDIYEEWEKAAKTAVRDAKLGDLIRASDMLHEQENIEIDVAVYNALEEFICSSLQERVDKLEESVEVLLKQHANEPAGITVAQLNKLKGGYQ